MGYYDNALEHHGILGQKWGVRRFENKNGTLTAAGRKRYDTDENGNYKKLNNAFSAKAAGHKALSKVYGLNEKTYAKSNKTLSSMNRAAKEDQLKKAEQAQKEANERKANRTGLSDGQKKAIVVGAAAVGTALAVYGGYKLANSPQGKAAIAKVLSKSKNLKDTITNSVKAERAMPKQEKIDNVRTASKMAIDIKANYTMPPKQTETVKKAAETVKTQVKTVSPEKFTYETFKPVQFNFDKFGYEKFQTAAQANDDLVNDLLKRNGKALGF